MFWCVHRSIMNVVNLITCIQAWEKTAESLAFCGLRVLSQCLVGGCGSFLRCPSPFRMPSKPVDETYTARRYEDGQVGRNSRYDLIATYSTIGSLGL